jgi:hypothetical protein
VGARGRRQYHGRVFDANAKLESIAQDVAAIRRLIDDEDDEEEEEEPPVDS